jgi:hypothetical protein
VAVNAIAILWRSEQDLHIVRNVHHEKPLSTSFGLKRPSDRLPERLVFSVLLDREHLRYFGVRLFKARYIVTTPTATTMATTMTEV